MAKFGFVFKLLGYHIPLFEGKSDFGFVEMNEYVYYNITLNDTANVTSVTIRLEAISGVLSFLTSRMYEEPTFQDIFLNGSDIVYVWNGTATYYGDFDKPFYVGIMGETEGLYRIGTTVGRNENLPSNYFLLSDEVINEFKVADSTPLLLKYSPHSIPYAIAIWPRPPCLSYGPSLPLALNCSSTIPYLLSTPVFINISNSSANTTYRIYISEGEFELTNENPLFIQCQDSCYENVLVEVRNGTERVIHSGAGRLINQATKEEVYNGVLDVACEGNQTTCEVKLIARLDYGGEMTLTLESSDILELTYWTSSITLNSLPKRLFYKLPKETSTVINIDSKGAVLKVASKLQILDSTYTNLLELEFSEDYDEEDVDPFQRTSMIEVSEKEAREMGCFLPTSYCVLTLEIDLDEEYEYSQDFVKNGVVYISAASGTYGLYENIRTRRFSSNSINYFEYRSNQQKNVTVVISPVSNCHPEMLYSDQEGEFATKDKYTLKSDKNLTVYNTSHVVVGVKTEGICVYDLILLTNEANYTFMVEGMPQKIYIPAKSSVYLLYNARNADPFQIQSTSQNIEICASPLAYGSSPNTNLPTPSTSTYHSLTAPLSIAPNSTSNYVIRLYNNYSYPVIPNVMVKV